MSALRDYLEKRQSEIRKQMEPLEAAIASLRSQLATADAQLRGLANEAAEVERALQAIGRKESRSATVTIKDAVLTVLGEAPQGMSSNEILAALNERFFDGTLRRTSMSPQLSRLKNGDQKIKRRGDRYFLA